MGAFATVKFLSLAFALLAGLSVYLFAQLRKERSRATLTLNNLSESKARSIAALKKVISDLRKDNAALFNSAKTQEKIIESASGVFKRHVDQLARQEKTISTLTRDSGQFVDRLRGLRTTLGQVHAMAAQLASKYPHNAQGYELTELARQAQQDATAAQRSLRDIHNQSQG